MFPNGTHSQYLHSLNTPGDFHLCLPFHTLPVDAHDLITRGEGAILGRGGVVEHLDHVETGAVRSSATNTNANEVLWVLDERHSSRCHHHTSTMYKHNIHTSPSYNYRAAICVTPADETILLGETNMGWSIIHSKKWNLWNR